MTPQRALGVALAGALTLGAVLFAMLGGVDRLLGVPEPAPEAAPAPKPRKPAPKAGRSGLVMPEPKPCLAGPSVDGTADEAMAASEGLSAEQVSAAMTAFLPNVLVCFEGGDPAPSDALRLDFLVGCNGRVKDIRIDGQGDWSAATSACVTDILRYAPFPAHALPDGDTFVFPLRYSPP